MSSSSRHPAAVIETVSFLTVVSSARYLDASARAAMDACQARYSGEATAPLATRLLHAVQSAIALAAVAIPQRTKGEPSALTTARDLAWNTITKAISTALKTVARCRGLGEEVAPYAEALESAIELSLLASKVKYASQGQRKFCWQLKKLLVRAPTVYPSLPTAGLLKDYRGSENGTLGGGRGKSRSSRGAEQATWDISNSGRGEGIIFYFYYHYYHRGSYRAFFSYAAGPQGNRNVSRLRGGPGPRTSPPHASSTGP